MENSVNRVTVSFKMLIFHPAFWLLLHAEHLNSHSNSTISIETETECKVMTAMSIWQQMLCSSLATQTEKEHIYARQSEVNKVSSVRKWKKQC